MIRRASWTFPDYTTKYSEKYNDFVSFLNEESLAVGIKWYNANSKTSYKQDISTHDTKKY